jgi:hypothetical protein
MAVESLTGEMEWIASQQPVMFCFAYGRKARQYTGTVPLFQRKHCKHWCMKILFNSLKFSLDESSIGLFLALCNVFPSTVCVPVFRLLVYLFFNFDRELVISVHI